MVSAQEWLDKSYPIETRTETLALHINDKDLEGELEIKNFPKLESFGCFSNKLTKLTIINCPNIVVINCGYNNFSDYNFLDYLDNSKITYLALGEAKDKLPSKNKDLGYFTKFVNLRTLVVSWCDFSNSSLECLKDMKSLEVIAIHGTNIESGLEYLPETVKFVHTTPENEKSFGCWKLAEQLRDYKTDAEWGGRDYKFKYSEWRNDNRNLVEIIKNPFYKKLQEQVTKLTNQLKQKEIEINHLYSQLKKVEELIGAEQQLQSQIPPKN